MDFYRNLYNLRLTPTEIPSILLWCYRTIHLSSRYELLQDCKDVDAVFLTVGGGGLASGVSAYLKHQNPKIQV